MEHFIETVETIDKGVGFSHFDLCHILWLVAFCVIALTASLLYRKLSGKGRRIMQWGFTAFIIADELWKWGWLFYMDLTLPKYLPLHLCSINIFLILFYTIKPTRTVGNFLYMACLPGALLALLTPTWTKLPFLISCICTASPSISPWPCFPSCSPQAAISVPAGVTYRRGSFFLQDWPAWPTL